MKGDPKRQPNLRLKQERVLRGWSQGDLAEKVAVDTLTVYRWESGVSFPMPIYRQKLCELFGKNAKELGLIPGQNDQKDEHALHDTAPQLSPVPQGIINAQEAIRVFRQFMQHDSPHRVFCLTGEGKMGKSHLLTAVFPVLAQQDYQAHRAVIDLRNQLLFVPDILHITCRQLGSQICSGYYAAYQVWVEKSRKRVNILRAFLSQLNLFPPSENDLPSERDRYLTNRLVDDLSKLHDEVFLLIFDSVNSATESMQTWLMDLLLPQLASLSHVRTIVAGRSLPDAQGSYRTSCQSYRLLPVTEEEAYIAYCQMKGVTLVEQSIRDFARASGYRPGLFVDLVFPTFVSQRPLHG